MNMFTPTEFVENYTAIGAKKSKMPFLKMSFLGILTGVIIALAAVFSSSASFAVANPSIAKLISGLLFPFGLIIVIIIGGELFTGNCMITISVLNKQAKLTHMLRNLLVVFIGNFIGALIVAAGCAFFGQFELGGGTMAVAVIKTAVAKSTLPFANAFVLGIFCNLLVCMGLMLSLCGKDLAGRAIGAYVPVAIFVVSGFEHCVANMYYIPAGIFAASVPKYAQMAAEASIDTSALSWGTFLGANLLPVTLGNIFGGVVFALIMWYCHGKKK